MTEYPTRTEGLLLERDVNRSLRSLAHDIPPLVLAAILPMLAELDDAKDLNRRAISVPVHRILATAWRADRLARCERLLAEGQKPPPVHLVRYKLAGENWYTVSDGHHRTVAARNAGRKRIRAVVGCETPIHPDRYVLRDGRLWRKTVHESYGACLERVPVDITPEVAQALQIVEVEEKP